jgi:hypothetical protein
VLTGSMHSLFKFGIPGCTWADLEPHDCTSVSLRV